MSAIILTSDLTITEDISLIGSDGSPVAGYEVRAPVELTNFATVTIIGDGSFIAGADVIGLYCWFPAIPTTVFWNKPGAVFEVVGNGVDAYGLSLVNRAAVTNEGTIRVTSTDAARGVELHGDQSLTFTNTGLLQVSGQSSGVGVFMWWGGTFDNAGTIEVSGGDLGSVGVNLYAVSGQNTSFTNSGTITAIATGNFPSMGVTVAGGGVVINNSGTIAGDYAIWENQIFVTPQEWSQSIQNSGTLIGAVDLGLGRDVVDNSGLIDGLVDLGDGNDIYYGTLGVVLEPVIGGRGDDTLIGGYGDEVLVGYDDLSEDPPADSDILVGGGGSDVLLAGAGDDYLYIDHLDAVIDAGEGYDAIVIQDDTGTSLDVGAASAEWVYAWTGDDTLDASSSAAGVALVGEAGSDVLIGSAHNDYIYMDAFDTVDAGDGYDALFVYQGSGQGVVDTFIDVSAANAEWVLGGAGNDIITNLGDVDGVALSGGGGNDQLTGGLGNDYLYGNEGSDTFIVTSNAQLDAILDFEVGVDKVDLGAIGGIVDFAGLVAASTESGGSTMLDLGGGSQLLLYGVPLASLSAGDFIFSA
jgi:hypothetical protein